MPDKSRSVVYAITTYYKSVEETRFKLACKTISSAISAGYAVVVVDGSPDTSMKEKFTTLGAKVFPELHRGLGPCRRQSYFHAVEVCNQGEYGAVLALEAEKDLAQFVPEIMEPLHKRGAHVVLPARTEKGWASYPEFQVTSEKAANAVYEEAIGFGDDIFFGPVLFVPEPGVSGYFLSQKAAKLGFPDTYAQHLGVILARHHSQRVRVANVPIDFLYPEIQKEEELGKFNEDMLKKRKDQFETLTDGYRKVTKSLRSPVIDML